MFSPSWFANSLPDGIGVLEIVGNGKKRKRDRAGRFVPLKRTVLRGEVVGPLASLCLTQTFSYSRQQCDQVVEAVYRFPLPGDAAVTGVVVRFGEVEISATLGERSQAEAEYQEARQTGRQAALVTREGPDVFTLQVAGLQPDQEVVVETSYVELARAEGAGWSLRLPLTTAPRYVRSDELTGRHAHSQPLALMRDPGHRFALDLELHGAAEVVSPTHALDTVCTEDGLRVKLAAGEVLPDSDLLLSWQPHRPTDCPEFRVWSYHDPSSQHTYFLALVAPPSAHQPGTGVPREVILLEDHSGSMSGAKWEAADWATKQFLSSLGERDGFALGLFHSEIHWLARKVQPATRERVQQAIGFLEGHKDSGGTELGVALEQALHLGRARGEHARHVLIITDAEVTDSGRILRLAEEESERADRRRINVLCIDAAPNSFLALELAERGGGRAEFLTSSPDEEDIASALERILDSWAEPVLTGLCLELDCSGLEVAGRAPLKAAAGASRADVGDLPCGRTVWLIGRVPHKREAAIEFNLSCAGDGKIASCGAAELPGETLGQALKALFGARQLLALEYLIHGGYQLEELCSRLSRLGYDPDQVLAQGQGEQRKLYPENARADVHDALRQLLVRESLHYGLLCSETAFVAVRKEAGQPVGASVVVANALPRNWSEEFAWSPGRSSIPLFRMASRLDVTGCRLSAAPAVQPLASPALPLLRSGRNLYAQSFQADEPGESRVVFSGVPSFSGGEAVLVDTTRPADRELLPRAGLISGIAIEFPDGQPDPDSVDPELVLLVFIGDMVTPRASLRLRDLLRQGGRRPLNLARKGGEPVRLVILDPNAAWSAGLHGIAVSVELG